MKSTHPTFTPENYLGYCDRLTRENRQLASIVDAYGYPPIWERTPAFKGLVRIILEQQVSLASAWAVYRKLENRINVITLENIAGMDDEGFQVCGFSRQKRRYVRILADEILHNGLDLDGLRLLPDEAVRQRLIGITGIGQWTSDIYLLLCLKRVDIFPLTDLALVKAMKENGLVPGTAGKPDIEKAAERCRPYRSILALILWHAYVQKRGMVVG